MDAPLPPQLQPTRRDRADRPSCRSLPPPTGRAADHLADAEPPGRRLGRVRRDLLLPVDELLSLAHGPGPAVGDGPQRRRQQHRHGRVHRPGVRLLPAGQRVGVLPHLGGLVQPSGTYSSGPPKPFLHIYVCNNVDKITLHNTHRFRWA